MLNIENVLGGRHTCGDCPVEWSGVGCRGRFSRLAGDADFSSDQIPA